MARKRHTAEQVVNLLRQVEVAIANGKTTALACKEASITEQTYYRWRREYGGLQVDQACRNICVRITGRSSWRMSCANGWRKQEQRRCTSNLDHQGRMDIARVLTRRCGTSSSTERFFYSIKELRVLAERWRKHYNTVRPHSSLGYRPPAPEAWLTNNMGHREVETATRFPLLHTPDGGYLNSEIAALH